MSLWKPWSWQNKEPSDEEDEPLYVVFTCGFLSLIITCFIIIALLRKWNKSWIKLHFIKLPNTIIIVIKLLHNTISTKPTIQIYLQNFWLELRYKFKPLPTNLYYKFKVAYTSLCWWHNLFKYCKNRQEKSVRIVAPAKPLNQCKPLFIQSKIRTVVNLY